MLLGSAVGEGIGDGEGVGVGCSGGLKPPPGSSSHSTNNNSASRPPPIRTRLHTLIEGMPIRATRSQAPNQPTIAPKTRVNNPANTQTNIDPSPFPPAVAAAAGEDIVLGSRVGAAARLSRAIRMRCMPQTTSKQTRPSATTTTTFLSCVVQSSDPIFIPRLGLAIMYT